MHCAPAFPACALVTSRRHLMPSERLLLMAAHRISWCPLAPSNVAGLSLPMSLKSTRDSVAASAPDKAAFAKGPSTRSTVLWTKVRHANARTIYTHWQLPVWIISSPRTQILTCSAKDLAVSAPNPKHQAPRAPNKRSIPDLSQLGPGEPAPTQSCKTPFV